MTDDVGSTSDDELDDLIRGSLPQLDVVAFMRLADLDLPDQLAPGELAPDQPLQRKRATSGPAAMRTAPVGPAD